MKRIAPLTTKPRTAIEMAWFKMMSTGLNSRSTLSEAMAKTNRAKRQGAAEAVARVMGMAVGVDVGGGNSERQGVGRHTQTVG